MSVVDANDLLFGNFCDSLSKLEEIEKFREHFERFLEQEREYFEGAHTDLQIEYLPLFADTFPPILHSSIIISVAVLLELEMGGYCAALREGLNLDLRLGDLAGNILDRFKAYTARVARLDVDFIKARWEDTVGIFEIRNCLVHSGGNLGEFSRASVIRTFAAHHNTPTCEADRLRIGPETSSVVLSIATDFLHVIYNNALSIFPGRWGPLPHQPYKA